MAAEEKRVGACTILRFWRSRCQYDRPTHVTIEAEFSAERGLSAFAQGHGRLEGTRGHVRVVVTVPRHEVLVRPKHGGHAAQKGIVDEMSVRVDLPHMPSAVVTHGCRALTIDTVVECTCVRVELLLEDDRASRVFVRVARETTPLVEKL